MSIFLYLVMKIGGYRYNEIKRLCFSVLHGLVYTHPSMAAHSRVCISRSLHISVLQSHSSFHPPINQVSARPARSCPMENIFPPGLLSAHSLLITFADRLPAQRCSQWTRSFHVLPFSLCHSSSFVFPFSRRLRSADRTLLYLTAHFNHVSLPLTHCFYAAWTLIAGL